MEIIGVCGNSRQRPDILVRMTHYEMQIIAGGHEHANLSFYSGSKLDIHKRFVHSQYVLERIEKAKKTGGQLRALADTLELAFPALEQIAAVESEVGA